MALSSCVRSSTLPSGTFHHNLAILYFLLIAPCFCRVWFPTVQFTTKIYRPKTGQHEWRSINVSNFASPPVIPGKTFDKRSSKADEFSVIHHPSPAPGIAEKYTINANVSKDYQISLEVSRPAGVDGWKFGNGPKGGFSYFGTDAAKPDGYVVHRFWPQTATSGHIIVKGQAIEATGSGMFVHAIQGMRPNLIASRWNFAYFTSPEQGGTTAIQMEFTTTPAHGKTGAGSEGVKVNIGSLVVGGKLVAVTGETGWPGEDATEGAIVSRATHFNTFKDKETGYQVPSKIVFQWAGSSLLQGAQGTVKADIQLDVGTYDAPKGLLQKVDVLAEIPKVLKMAVNYVAGTKPYIYQVRSSLSSFSLNND